MVKLARYSEVGLGAFLFLFLFLFLVLICRPLLHAAEIRADGHPGGVLGQAGTGDLGRPFDPDGLGDITREKLLELDRTLPDQFYQFDPNASVQRLDLGIFDPYLDTLPFRNKGTFSSPGGNCFGMSMVALRWFQDEVLSRARPLSDEVLGVHGRYLLPDEVRHLRPHVLASKQAAIEGLKEVLREQPTQGRSLPLLMPNGQEWAPGPRSLYHDHLLAELSDPSYGGTQIGIYSRDGNQDLFGHSLLAYGLLEGAARAGNGHLVHAVRVELYDSNFAVASKADAEDYRNTIHLLYFPASGKFSYPRNRWYQVLEGHVLEGAWKRLHGSDPAKLQEGRLRAEKDLLFQPHPSYLEDDWVTVNKVNHRVWKLYRKVFLSWLQRDPVETAIREKIARQTEAEVFAHPHRGPGGPRPMDFGPISWEGMDRVIDDQVDAYILDTFDVEAVQAAGAAAEGGEIH